MDSSGSPNRFSHFVSSKWQAFLSRFGKNGAALLITLLVMLIGSLVFIEEAETPWGKTVQKRLAKNQHLQAKEYAVIGLWWGAVVSAGTLALLLASANKWVPRPSTSAMPPPGIPMGKPFMSSAMLLVLTSGALALGAWERLPRMNQSLWNDEEYAMRSFAHGEWEPQKEGPRAFELTSWTHTLFDNDHGNNHLLNSFVMRVTLSAWKSISGAPVEAFNEVALRIPSLITGMLTIALLAWMGIEMGRPLVGVAAAYLMAVSPWHIHYATDAKGYAMMMFFIALNLIAITRALRGNKIRWWLLFALTEAAYLLSFAGSVYIALMVNIFALLELMRKLPRTRVLTLIAFNLIGAIPVIIWMMPSIPQILEYLHSPESLHLGMDAAWVYDLFSNLFAGWSWDSPYPNEHLGSSWLIMKAAHPVLLPVFAFFVIPVIAVAGFIRALKSGPMGRSAIVALILAAALAFLHNFIQGTPMVVWYLLYVLIALALMLPLGLTFKSRRFPWLSPVLIALFVTAYGTATWDANLRQRAYDRQPMRQTVAYIRSEAPDALTAIFGVSDRQTRCYDPHVKVLTSEADLQASMDEARSRNLPLYVYYCGDLESGTRRPDVMKRLKGGDFQFLKLLPGLEELFSYRVYKMN